MEALPLNFGFAFRNVLWRTVTQHIYLCSRMSVCSTLWP